jgi:hypothetical protein
MARLEDRGSIPAGKPAVPRAFAAFTVACLVVAVATQAMPLLHTLRWFAGEVAGARPYDLRLHLNDWFRDAVMAARAIEAEAPAEAAVLLDHTGSEAWFVGLRLQPRRVFVDRPAVRERLAAAGQPFLVVHLERPEGGPTWWWFEVDDGRGGLRRVGHPPPAISGDDFEDGLDRWIAVGAREHLE